MTGLDRIVQTYTEDTAFLEKRQVVTEQRKASIPRYNAFVQQFVEGRYTLDQFRNALKTLHQDTYWGAHKTFLQELNKLAKYHVPVSPEIETKFRLILHDLNARNVGQRIEQFYDLLTQEKSLLEAEGVADGKIVSPGNSALIISLMAFWLDSAKEPYICYPSLCTGLRILLKANLIPLPASLQINKNFDIKAQADYQTITQLVDIVAEDQPKLRSGAYWAENFFLWVEDNQSHKYIRHHKSRKHSALSCAPLPSRASRAAIDSLTQLGFEETGIVEDFIFTTTKNEYIQLNALVFAHPSQRDLDDYASITMFRAVNGQTDRELVTRLAETSAPVHLIHHENGFALWASSMQTDNDKKVHVQPIQINEFIPYNRLKDVMREYVGDLKPQRIIDVKQGRDAFKHTPFQAVNLVHLSSWAEDIRRKPLVKRFAQAVDTLWYHPTHLSRDEITMIATQLLGLLILADTGILGDDIRLERPFLSFEEMVAKAHKQYAHFFDSDLLLKRYPNAAERAYHILRNMQYAGFTPNMLSDLYLATYTFRYHRIPAIYDAPLYLARRILDNIPLEYLRPEERVVADFTCGWGSFLIASLERLANLSDSDEVPLQQCIYGHDHDKFLVQLTRLGLLYTAAKDGWHVDHEDMFPPPDTQGVRANVIIGNALFTGGDKTGRADEEEFAINVQKETFTKHADEKEMQHLAYAIQQLMPGGYLAFIMSRAFASSQHGSKTRKKLLEECDILELWELPREIFRGATTEALIIFAQKKSRTDHDKPSFTCVRTRTLLPATIDNFRSSGTFTASALVLDQLAWSDRTWKSDSDQAIDCVLGYTTILSTSAWSTIEQHCNRLHEYTYNMFKVGKSKKVPKDFFSLQTPKILLQYLPYEQWGKRVRAAIISNKGDIAENSFLIDPKHTLWNLSLNMPDEVLTAILGWDVSNIWVIEHAKSPDVLTQVIRNIPIPRELTEQERQILINAVLRLEEEKRKWQAMSPTALQAQDEIDLILRNAYHLDDATFQQLRQVTQWMDRSYITLDVQPDLTKTDWFTSGVVEDVFAADGQIELWIDGFDNLQKVRIVPSMPGWMLRFDAAFLTKFPREFRRRRKFDPENIDWAYFQPQPYMYMSEEELLTGISQHFVRPPE